VVARVLIPVSLLTEAPLGKAADKPVLPAPRKEEGQDVPAGELVTVSAGVQPAENTTDKAGNKAANKATDKAANKTVNKAAGAKGGTSAARTRNGLVKRPQRSAISDAVSETDRPDRPAPAEPAADRSPEEISGMLSTLRSAHMRGGISVEKEKQKDQQKDQRKDAEQKDAEQSEGDVK
jgi:hypothetical protein